MSYPTRITVLPLFVLSVLVQRCLVRGLDLDAMVALIPIGRMAEEIDHAHLVAYFASDEAKHVTGQVVSVDGAQSLYHPLAAVRIEKTP